MGVCNGPGEKVTGVGLREVLYALSVDDSAITTIREVLHTTVPIADWPFKTVDVLYEEVVIGETVITI